MSECRTCHGERLLIAGWRPSPQRPYPDPCPTCSATMSARERQVLQQEWLLDHQNDPKVVEILAQLAVVNRHRYRKVLYLPTARTAEEGPLDAIRDADLVVVAGNMVVKDRYSAAGYVLSDSELRRIKDSCEEFTRR